jgi:hypothetical protein
MVLKESNNTDLGPVRTRVSNKSSVTVIARHEAICVTIFGNTTIRSTDCFVPRNDGRLTTLIEILSKLLRTLRLYTII